MSKEGHNPYQLHLGEKIPETIFFFEAGVMIYPKGSKRGELRNGIFAEKIEGIKTYGLTSFKALQRLDLELNNRYWSLPEGTVFGAYAKKAKKREIK